MTKQNVVREGPAKITRTTVKAAWDKRAPNQRIIIRDLECRGLALIINAASMAWRYEYKPRGTDPQTGRRFASRSIVLGNPASLSPDQARETANKIKGQAKAGKDPAAERKAKLAEHARKRAGTLKRLLDIYAEALPKRPKLRGGGKLNARGVADELSHARAAIMAMNASGKAADDVSEMEVRRLLEGLADKTATARHRFGALSRFYDWALDEGYCHTSPCAKISKARRPRPPKPRDDFNTPEELSQIWNAIQFAEGLNQVHRDLLHFLIAVPCRRGEAANLRWKDVNLNAGIWTQPGRQTKNGEEHRFYLPGLALSILKRRYADAINPTDGFVFPAPKSGKAIANFGKIKRAIDKGLNSALHWRIHDHRRSFVTALAEAGANEAVLDSILNHKQAATRSGVLGVYQKAQRWPEQIEAMVKWHSILTEYGCQP